METVPGAEDHERGDDGQVDRAEYEEGGDGADSGGSWVGRVFAQSFLTAVDGKVKPAPKRGFVVQLFGLPAGMP